jgi:hypothetical protein
MDGATGLFVYVSAPTDAREYLVWKVKNSKTTFRPLPSRLKVVQKQLAHPVYHIKNTML